jgi:hypothetical protein
MPPLAGKGNEHESLGPVLHPPARGSVSVVLPPPRRAPNRVAWRRARYYRGPTWSCAEAAMALAGRAVALAPDDRGRRETLREDARILAALVREREVSKAAAVDRILNAGIAFGVPDAEIDEILFSEFSA